MMQMMQSPDLKEIQKQESTKSKLTFKTYTETPQFIKPSTVKKTVKLPDVTKKVSLKVGTMEKEKSASLSIVKNFNKVIQSGNESLTKFQTRTVLNPTYEMPPLDSKESTKPSASTDTFNKFKRQYTSGYQVQAAKDLLTSEKMILKEKTMPALIKIGKYQGNVAYSNANSHNGYMKAALIEKAKMTV
jgi:hypothetical protein